jgi:cytochrome b561
MTMQPMIPCAPDTMHRYSGIAVLAHWLTTVGIGAMLALGWTMTALEDEAGSAVWFGWHRSLGVLLVLLVLARLLWRWRNSPAAPRRASPRIERLAATLMHRLLYLMLFAMPITGLAGAWTSEDGLGVFGHMAPQPLGVHKLLSETLFNLHAASAWVLVILVGLHAAAALRHRLAGTTSAHPPTHGSTTASAGMHRLGAYPRRRLE